MKRATYLYAVLITLLAINVRAADPGPQGQSDAEGKPSVEESTQVTEPVIPKRELTFERSEKEYSMPFYVPDPELFQQRYVAVFRSVGLPQTRPSFGPGFRRRDNVEMNLRKLYSMAFHKTPGPHPQLLLQLFADLARNTPENRLPSKDIVLALTTKAGTLIRSRIQVSPNPNDPRTSRFDYHFEVLAPTPERAEELVEGLLVLYDWGLSYATQKEYLRLRQAAEKRLSGRRDAAKKATVELSSIKTQLEELKEFEDLTSESLVNFTTQLRLISVDLAGIRARIEACHRILVRESASKSRAEQVETVKVTAEIELVGLAARKAAIEEIVENGRRRLELAGKCNAAAKNARNLQFGVTHVENQIHEYEAARKQYEPFAIQDGKVTIHPIKWETPQKK